MSANSLAFVTDIMLPVLVLVIVLRVLGFGKRRASPHHDTGGARHDTRDDGGAAAATLAMDVGGLGAGGGCSGDAGGGC